MAADLDPAAVLLAGMAMVAAPIIMPGVARELFGVDPSSPEFRERYAGQLRRIVARLGSGPASETPASETPASETPPGGGQATGGSGC